MLKNLTELGEDIKKEFDNFNDWQEIIFNTKDKEELGKLDRVTKVFDSSIKFELESNHVIVPSQYILYAIVMKHFALGLREHLDIFDAYKRGKSANQVGDEITNRTFARSVIGVDEFSKTILMEPLINSSYNFEAKNIVNGSHGKYKIRGTNDFFTSVILKIINIPDASSSILGKLIYSLAGSPDIYKYLETRFIKSLPYLTQDSTTKGIARKIFTYLYQYDNLQKIKKYITKNNDVNFSSIKTKDNGLTSIFKTSTNLLSEEDLKQGGKVRYFKEPLFIIDNEFYYFSTEWTDGTDSRLDLQSLTSIIELTYNEFSINNDKGTYQLISSFMNSSRSSDSLVSTFSSDISISGLKFSPNLITRFIASLVTKPFVLLSGLSGSGKTKLAQSFAQWICENETQYCIVPVGADWTNKEPLLGYVNALNPEEYIFPENGALQLLIEANKPENKDKPYFLILDEMNMSHVERYFADFLSVMESKEKFKLHSSKLNLNVTNGVKYINSIEVPNELAWPKNLFVVGTVNIDETTYMFSPKVLDRANVIEFRINETEMESYLVEPKNVIDLNGEGKTMGESFVSIANDKTKVSPDNLKKTLNSFFTELQKVGAEFGYRTASEIQTLFGQIGIINPELKQSAEIKLKYKTEDDYKIDIAIMQKLLPKLHGSRNKLVGTLSILASLCYKEDSIPVTKDIFTDKSIEINKLNIIYPLSLEKITRMYHNVISNGFTSYAEA